MSAYQMEGDQRIKMDFPLVKTISRDKLIDWFRETLSPKLHTIKELGTGADFCLGLEMIFPGCIGKHRIKFDNPSIYDRRQHFKLLQSAFNSLNLVKDVPIEKLEEGNYGETYYFALWFKAFFEANNKGQANDLKRFQSPVYPTKHSMVKGTAGGFRQLSSSSQPKDAKLEYATKKRSRLNSDKCQSQEMKIPLSQRKSKRCVIPHKIINPRMATCSRMEHEHEHEIPTLNITHTDSLAQMQIKALTQQTEELQKTVKGLTERKKLMEDDKVDFEKRIENLEQQKINRNPEPNETKDPSRDLVVVVESSQSIDTREDDKDVLKNVLPPPLDLQRLDLEIQIEQIYQVVKEQRVIIDELEQQKESKDEQIATLERIISELTAAIEEFEIVKQTQSKQIKSLQQSPSQKEFEQIINDQLKRLEDIQKTNGEQAKKIDKLQKENKSLLLNNTVSTKSNKAMAVHIEDLEQSYKDLIKQNDHLTKYNKELACYYSDLSNENRELYQRNKRLAKNYETVLCYSCLDANLYFKQLVRIEKACKREPNSSLRKCVTLILNQTKYHPPLTPGFGGKKERK